MPPVDRRIALALAIPAFVVALFWGRLTGGTSTPHAPASSTSIAAAQLAAPDVARVLVHVVGAVRHAAVYRLAATARVLDAVRAAGGATHAADLEAIDLAAPLVDGSQIVVPRRGVRAVVAAPPAAASAPPPPVAPVHINVAGATALETLPGVGPATAARIIAWRSAHGRFHTVADLLEIPGIGPAKLAALHDLALP